METSRIRGPFVALALLVAQSAIAQDSPVFTRRSTQPTPTVTDVEVLRHQRIEVVCSPKDEYLAVITSYVPDPAHWSSDFRRRRA